MKLTFPEAEAPDAEPVLDPSAVQPDGQLDLRL